MARYFHLCLRYPVTIAWSTLASIGILTNLCNIVVLGRYKMTSLVLYLRCLSTFDLGFCITIIFSATYGHFGYATHGGVVAYVYISFPASMLFSVLGTYTIVIISVERAFGALFPFVAQRKLSLNVSKVIMVVMVVMVTSLRLPVVYSSFGFQEVAPGYYSHTATALFRTKIGLSLWIMMAMIFEFIPFIIMAISNCIVMRSIWRLKKDMSKLTSEAATMDPKVSIMLVGIVILFLICEVPLTVSWLVTMPPEIFVVVEPLTTSLVILNRSSNMFIYVITSAEYRHHLRARFGCGESGQIEPWNQLVAPGEATVATPVTTRDTNLDK